MLFINRKKNESITINGTIKIIIKSVRNGIVRLGIIADPNRTEIKIGDETEGNDTETSKNKGNEK